jgi:hypothetical protein
MELLSLTLLLCMFTLEQFQVTLDPWSLSLEPWKLTSGSIVDDQAGALESLAGLVKMYTQEILLHVLYLPQQ